jgi:DNA-binding IclR family transcriptional regulator
MRVIEALAARPDGLALAELGRELNLPKTSLFSMLRALESEAYVANAGGVYRLGAAALRLGALIGGGDALERKLSPLLAPVVKKAEETVLLAVPTEDRREVRYIAIADGPQAVRYAATIGLRRPLYCTASGRAVLAFSDPAMVRDYLARAPRPQLTPHTATSKAALLDIIAEIRRAGVAETRDQMFVGLWGFGAPVFDAQRAVVASLMIAAPADRARRKRAALVAAVREGAEEMSRVLGLSGGYIAAR